MVWGGPNGSLSLGQARTNFRLYGAVEERFKVHVHTEMRETQTYALLLSNKDGKLGPQLHESKVDCYSPASPPPQGQPPDPARQCGIRGGAPGSGWPP